MNCTSATANPSWVTAATCQKCFISFLGTVGNSISLWCLVHCIRTNMATKFHLIFVFSVLLAISLVILPYVAFINYISAFCKVLFFPEKLIVTISITSSFLLQLERINFTAVAVLRCLAVLRPLTFQKLSKIPIMMLIEAALCLYVFLPWVLGLSLADEILYDKQRWTVSFGDDSVLEKMIFTWYDINYCLTFMVTLLAYTLMVVKIVHQKRRLAADQIIYNTMDQVSFTIHVVLLTNLLLDGPHMMVHMLKYKGLTSIIIHMVFYLHLVIDPLVFVGLNRHYRSALLRRLHTCLPLAFSVYFVNPATSDIIQKTQDTPLHMSTQETAGIPNVDSIKCSQASNTEFA